MEESNVQPVNSPVTVRVQPDSVLLAATPRCCRLILGSHAASVYSSLYSYIACALPDLADTKS